VQKRRPKIIRDNQKRGEWAELVFAAPAAENGLEISKPFGESGRFDCVIGGPGKFVAVQVKCTIAKQHNAKGYICNLKSNNQEVPGGVVRFSGSIRDTRRHVVHRSRESDSRDGSDLSVQHHAKV